MAIVEEYSRQYPWRSWSIILAALPDLDGQRVLDLGCGVGDVAACLSARGARVLGVDINEELIAFAKNRSITNAEFRVADLRTFHDPSLRVNGIWSSFTAAYFPAFRDTVASWIMHLQSDGWLALTELDDLFGHRPISRRTRELLSRYVQDSMEHGRYDFRMGGRIADELRGIGLTLLHEFTVPDAELSFSGRAAPEVLAAWRMRFDRMHLLRDFCGTEFDHVRDDFLTCLNRHDHSCYATVHCCIAKRNG